MDKSGGGASSSSSTAAVGRSESSSLSGVVTKRRLRFLEQKTTDPAVEWVTVGGEGLSRFFGRNVGPLLGEERLGAKRQESNRFDLAKFILSIPFEPQDASESTRLAEIVLRCLRRHGCTSLPALVNLDEDGYTAALSKGASREGARERPAERSEVNAYLRG